MTELSPKYFSIGEVSRILDVKPYTLRYWEKKTNLIKPVRRTYDRRYYGRSCLENLAQLKKLIVDQNVSIHEAVQVLEKRSSKAHQYADVLQKVRTVLTE